MPENVMPKIDNAQKIILKIDNARKSNAENK